MIAMGTDDRPPTDDELAHMKRLLGEALADGAVGLSTGLTYTPGMYADDDEIVALLEVVREHGGYYTPHHRSYGKRALEAYADCIEIARRSGVPLHFAHAHLGFPVNKGRAPELLAMIDQARDDGIEVTLDTYPYLAGSTYLHSILPSWMHVGGGAATIERLRDPSLRERLRVEIEEEGSDGFHEIPVDWSIIHVDGRPVSEAAAASGARPIDWVCELLVERSSASRALPTSATRRTCARRWPTGRTPSAATGSSSATGRTREAGGRSRATSPSTCASWGSSRGSRRCGR